MVQWLIANPSKANKTLWRKFVLQWLGKAQERAYNKKSYQSQKHSNSDRRTQNIDGTPVNSPADGLF